MNYETYKLLYNQLMALRDEQSAIANNKDTSRDDMNEAYAQRR